LLLLLKITEEEKKKMEKGSRLWRQHLLDPTVMEALRM